MIRAFTFLPVMLISGLAISQVPPISKPGQGGYLKGELIYSLENPPTPQTHASTLVETKSGIVTAFFSGTEERAKDVGIRVSRLLNGKWTWPQEVANGIINDASRYPCWNPVLFQPKTGPLLLFYKVGPTPRNWWGMVITSMDDGKTWSKPRKLGTVAGFGDLIGPVKNKPVQLSDGTIISPSSLERSTGGDEVEWKVHFEISKDNGATWKVVGPINDGVEFDAIQPSILVYRDGRLQAVCRTGQNVLSQSWSEDNGITWSKMTALSLPNPNAGTDAVTLKDGRQLLVYNHTRSGPGPLEQTGRNMLNVAISSDGINWKPVLTLENIPIPDGYAYPAVIQSNDGFVHITYTYNRRSIKYVVLDAEKL